MKRSMKALLAAALCVMMLFISCSREEEKAAEPAVTETVTEAPAAPVVKETADIEFAPAFPKTIRTDLEKFQYSYGWGLMEAILSQNLVPDGRYFARGVMDCAAMAEPLVPVEDIMTVLQSYLEDFEGGGEKGEWAELEDIADLPAPVSEEETFAYCYGFYNAFGILQQMIEIDGVWFPRGALDRLFEREGLLTEEEIGTSINSYFEEKEAEYQAWLEETAGRNLELAEKMLSAKKAEEGNIVLSDELVIVPISLSGSGVKADPEDSVTVNYTLRDVHGNTMDHGDAITFPLNGVIPGFRDACLAMDTGDHVYAYVHPSIGYGEYGTGNIAPNSLLVFEIELLDILAEN